MDAKNSQSSFQFSTAPSTNAACQPSTQQKNKRKNGDRDNHTILTFNYFVGVAPVQIGNQLLQSRNSCQLTLGEFMASALKIFNGDRFGRLTVVGNDAHILSGNRRLRAMQCLCECGTKLIARLDHLRSGATSSCGCLRREFHSRRLRKHGCAIKGRQSSEYRIWVGMITRCTNQNCDAFPRYGGRGITVCGRWRESFENFLADIGTRPSKSHSIDRINNNKGYEPGNVQWATTKQQARNRRSNHFLTFLGKTQSIAEWAEELGLSAATISTGLARGKTTEQALHN